MKMSPGNPAAYLQLGELLLVQGHIPEGRTMVQKALDMDPNSVRALGVLASLDLQAKQPAKAVERLQAQIAKEPANGGFYTQLATTQLLMGNYTDALASSQKAMQYSPNSLDAVNVYTQAQIYLHNVDSAIATWQGLADAHPNSAQPWQILGSLMEAKGDQMKAMDEYKKALQLDPNNAVSANNLAYLMVQNGQNADVALTLAQTARHAMPDSAHTADTLAWVYYFKGNYYAARDLLEGALRINPDNPSMNLHLGMTYSKMNDKNNAMQYLKKAAALQPNSTTSQTANAELMRLQ